MAPKQVKAEPLATGKMKPGAAGARAALALGWSRVAAHARAGDLSEMARSISHAGSALRERTSYYFLHDTEAGKDNGNFILKAHSGLTGSGNAQASEAGQDREGPARRTETVQTGARRQQNPDAILYSAYPELTADRVAFMRVQTDSPLTDGNRGRALVVNFRYGAKADTMNPMHSTLVFGRAR